MSRSLSEHERVKLAGEIAGLQSLDVEPLKGRWRTLGLTEAPVRFSPDLLIRAVAYPLQERALGGLKRATRRLFQRVAADARVRGARLTCAGAQARTGRGADPTVEQR
jgi:hypothetical protein